MIDTSVMTETDTSTEISFKDAKLSDWIRQQPPERLCPHTFRVGDRMCGLGLIADFHGIDWSSMRLYFPEGILYYNKLKINEFLKEKMGTLPFSGLSFDRIYREKGPIAARDWVADTLSSQGF